MRCRMQVMVGSSADIIPCAIRRPGIAAASARMTAKPGFGEGMSDTALAFQARVQPWMMACFGPEISTDIAERCHRFYEEAGELVQALGMTREEAHKLVDYTWDRPS